MCAASRIGFRDASVPVHSSSKLSIDTPPGWCQPSIHPHAPAHPASPHRTPSGAAPPGRPCTTQPTPNHADPPHGRTSQHNNVPVADFLRLQRPKHPRVGLAQKVCERNALIETGRKRSQVLVRHRLEGNRLRQHARKLVDGAFCPSTASPSGRSAFPVNHSPLHRRTNEEQQRARWMAAVTYARRAVMCAMAAVRRRLAESSGSAADRVAVRPAPPPRTAAAAVAA